MLPIAERRWLTDAGGMIAALPAPVGTLAARAPAPWLNQPWSRAAEMLRDRTPSRSRGGAAAAGSAGPTSCGGYSKSTSSSALAAVGAWHGEPTHVRLVEAEDKGRHGHRGEHGVTAIRGDWPIWFNTSIRTIISFEVTLLMMQRT
jgi:hypothetical protein